VIATPTDWVLSVAEYSIFIRPDLLQQFWQVMSDGGFITDAVAVIDTSRRTGRRVLVDAGGVRPRRGRGLKGRCLTFAEREEIALARAAGESMRSIADRLGRSASTISRELRRNLDRQGRYRSTAATAHHCRTPAPRRRISTSPSSSSPTTSLHTHLSHRPGGLPPVWLTPDL